MYKQYFPFFDKNINGKNIIYFDSACTYIKSNFSLNGINKYYNEFSCCSGDRESSYLGSILYGEINDARVNIRNFIGANYDDFVIFTSGTTDSINRLIFSLNEKEVKNIIVSDLEHNSNYLPQYEYSKLKGQELTVLSYIDILNFDKFEEYLKNIDGKFIFCFTHSSNIIGGKFDIKKLSSLVHKYGGYILVDDAQYISYNLENVVENGIDFLAFSSHKIGGPTGIGVLYIKKGLEDLIIYSSKIGGGTVKKIDSGIPEYKNLPYYFEGGVQDFSGIIGLNENIKFLNNLGLENINSYILSLSKYFIQQIKKRGLEQFLDIISIENSSLITIIPKNFNVIDFHSYCNYFLDKYIISFRTGTMCADNYVNNYLDGNTNIMRLSFGIYNTVEDINIFLDIITQYIKDIYN